MSATRHDRPPSAAAPRAPKPTTDARVAAVVEAAYILQERTR